MTDLEEKQKQKEKGKAEEKSGHSQGLLFPQLKEPEKEPQYSLQAINSMFYVWEIAQVVTAKGFNALYSVEDRRTILCQIVQSPSSFLYIVPGLVAGVLRHCSDLEHVSFSSESLDLESPTDEESPGQQEDRMDMNEDKLLVETVFAPLGKLFGGKDNEIGGGSGISPDSPGNNSSTASDFIYIEDLVGFLDFLQSEIKNTRSLPDTGSKSDSKNRGDGDRTETETGNIGIGMKSSSFPDTDSKPKATQEADAAAVQNLQSIQNSVGHKMYNLVISQLVLVFRATLLTVFSRLDDYLKHLDNKARMEHRDQHQGQNQPGTDRGPVPAKYSELPAGTTSSTYSVEYLRNEALAKINSMLTAVVDCVAADLHVLCRNLAIFQTIEMSETSRCKRLQDSFTAIILPTLVQLICAPTHRVVKYALFLPHALALTKIFEKYFPVNSPDIFDNAGAYSLPATNIASKDIPPSVTESSSQNQRLFLSWVSDKFKWILHFHANCVNFILDPSPQFRPIQLKSSLKSCTALVGKDKRHAAAYSRAHRKLDFEVWSLFAPIISSYAEDKDVEGKGKGKQLSAEDPERQAKSVGLSDLLFKMTHWEEEDSGVDSASGSNDAGKRKGSAQAKKKKEKGKEKEAPLLYAPASNSFQKELLYVDSVLCDVFATRAAFLKDGKKY